MQKALSGLVALSLFSPLIQAAPMAHPSHPTPSFPTLVSSPQNRLLLSNGFPNLSPQALRDVQVAAGGTLSNIPAAKKITDADSLTNFQLIAFNELFEVAFFTSFLQNVTEKVSGFEIPEGVNETFVIDTLIAVQAQEQLHAILANNNLAEPIQPCAYQFPSTDFLSAITLAQTFTDVALGTLQDVATIFAANNNSAVVRGVASVIGQEGQQDGFYRSLLGKTPSAQPFLTASARDFAFSALNQNFVVAGSCPNIETIPLEIFGVLTLETKVIEPKDQTLEFSIVVEDKGCNVEELRLVLVNGQNKPLIMGLEKVQRDGDKVTFEVEFPFEEEILVGLTIAAVVGKKGEGIVTVVDASKMALFGPALIEVN